MTARALPPHFVERRDMLDTLLRRRRWRDRDPDVTADRPPAPKPIVGGAAVAVD